MCAGHGMGMGITGYLVDDYCSSIMTVALYMT
ncbi:MAG: hypothetical protein ACI9S6_003425, partial [Reinekea sp.]